MAPAEVGLHEGADRVAALFGREFTGSGADAPGELEAGHARTATNVALDHCPGAGAVKGFDDVLVLDVKAVGVIEVAIVGLGHDRQHPRLPLALARGPPLDHRI